MSQPWTERFVTADVAPAAIITSWFDDLLVTDGELKQAREWLVVTGILALIGGTGAVWVRAKEQVGDRLSYKAFVRAWDRSAPEAWKKPGRKPRTDFR